VGCSPLARQELELLFYFSLIPTRHFAANVNICSALSAKLDLPIGHHQKFFFIKSCITASCSTAFYSSMKSNRHKNLRAKLEPAFGSSRHKLSLRYFAALPIGKY
jgi:hypothetical protein